jgi:hypothetical protein
MQKVEIKYTVIESRNGHLGLDLVQSFCTHILDLLESHWDFHPLHLSFLHYTILEGESWLHFYVFGN